MATLIDETDAIPCNTLPILIYGGPALRKTTIAQTADKTLTLDFDVGIHRTSYRKQALRFENWHDHLVNGGNDGGYHITKDGQKKMLDYRTLVLDTGGRALDTMIPGIMRESAKNGNPMGGLSPGGWGVLGNRFTVWLKQVLSWGKDFIMVCHEEESKSASGQPYFLPDLPGKMAWKEIHKSFDMIGRLYKENNRHYLTFVPTEWSVGKDAANLGTVELPEEHDPAFLAKLIATAKQRIGSTSAASAATANATATTQQFLAGKPGIEEFNAWLAKTMPGLSNGAKRQSWHLAEEYAKAQGWTREAHAKEFKTPVAESPERPTSGPAKPTTVSAGPQDNSEDEDSRPFKESKDGMNEEPITDPTETDTNGVQQTCKACKGTGSRSGGTCKACSGKGAVHANA